MVRFWGWSVACSGASACVAGEEAGKVSADRLSGRRMNCWEWLGWAPSDAATGWLWSRTVTPPPGGQSWSSGAVSMGPLGCRERATVTEEKEFGRRLGWGRRRVAAWGFRVCPGVGRGWGGGPPMALGWHGGGGIGSRGLTGGRVGSSVGGCLERSGGGWGMLVTAVWVVLMGSVTVWFVWRDILPRLGRGAAGDLGRGLVSSRGKGWVCGWGS